MVDIDLFQTLKDFWYSIGLDLRAIGIILLVLAGKLIYDHLKRPSLKIAKTSEIVTITLDNINQYLQYYVNRIIVRNTGRTAAKSCKGYLIFEGRKERVCWMIPDSRPMITIHPKGGEEKLDFCAIQNKIGLFPTVLFPTENGNWDRSRHLFGDEKVKVQITAENARPVSRWIHFDIAKQKIVLHRSYITLWFSIFSFK